MIEAMACGTPVLAFRCGSVPEIIDPGVTGHIVRTMDEAIKILPKVPGARSPRGPAAVRAALLGYPHGEGLRPRVRSLLKRPSLSERSAVIPKLEPDLEKSMT